MRITPCSLLQMRRSFRQSAGQYRCQAHPLKAETPNSKFADLLGDLFGALAEAREEAQVVGNIESHLQEHLIAILKQFPEEQ